MRVLASHIAYLQSLRFVFFILGSDWLTNQNLFEFLDLILIPPRTNGSNLFLIKRKLFQFKNYSQMETSVRNSHVVVLNILWVVRNHVVRRLRTRVHSIIHQCIQWVTRPHIRWVMAIIHQIFTDIINFPRPRSFPRSFPHQHNVLLQLLWWAKHGTVFKTNMTAHAWTRLRFYV